MTIEIQISTEKVTVAFDYAGKYPNTATITTDEQSFLNAITEQVEHGFITPEQLLFIIVKQLRSYDLETLTRCFPQKNVQLLINTCTAIYNDEVLPCC